MYIIIYGTFYLQVGRGNALRKSVICSWNVPENRRHAINCLAVATGPESDGGEWEFIEYIGRSRFWTLPVYSVRYCNIYIFVGFSLHKLLLNLRLDARDCECVYKCQCGHIMWTLLIAFLIWSMFSFIIILF